ncbi:GntR family transcriptional regulator [Streptomyces sp. NPDC102364]|uniref:GntR family transcriptional regulator n=1 Tax=Streptomyces sp. NPDC102364 TaxID=3366161 RepID=UPI0038239A43
METSADKARDGGAGSARTLENLLRNQILRGDYPSGAMLPTQRTLADLFGVSRDTVQRAQRQLIEDGWLESRQGSGTWVSARLPLHDVPASQESVTVHGQALLGPMVQAAFTKPEVNLDAFSLTCESLASEIRTQAERIKKGRQAPPQRIQVRLMLPSYDEPPLYPRATNPDDRRISDRWETMARVHTDSVRRWLTDLSDKVPEVEVEVHHVPWTPQFKLYILNETDVLFGLYEVHRYGISVGEGPKVDSLDVLGLAATMLHFRESRDPESRDSLMATSLKDWFESGWEHLR